MINILTKISIVTFILAFLSCMLPYNGVTYTLALIFVLTLLLAVILHLNRKPIGHKRVRVRKERKYY